VQDKENKMAGFTSERRSPRGAEERVMSDNSSDEWRRGSVAVAIASVALIVSVATFLARSPLVSFRACSGEHLQNSIRECTNYSQFKDTCAALHAKSGSHAKALRLLPENGQRSLYLFWACQSGSKGTAELQQAIQELPYYSMDPVLDLMTRLHDSECVRAIHIYKDTYFTARYPDIYFGTEQADNLEYDCYARRVVEEYMHRFDRYDRAGKETLVMLVHGSLTYEGRWEIIPDYMRRQLSHYLMNLVPGSGQNARLGDGEAWLKDTMLPVLAMQLVANTHSDEFTQTFAGYIKNTAQNREQRGNAFRALGKLAPPATPWIVRFLKESVERDDWKQNLNDILLAMAAIPSSEYIPALVAVIESDDLRCGKLATDAFIAIDSWEESFRNLPRATQVRICLMGAESYHEKGPRKTLSGLLKADDVQYLLPLLTLDYVKKDVETVRRAVKYLPAQSSARGIPQVVDLMEELVISGEGKTYWLLFGYCAEFMESAADRTFWPRQSGAELNSMRDGESKETRLELQKETLKEIKTWLVKRPDNGAP